MPVDASRLPIGQKVALPGHFDQPVTLEGVRQVGNAFECRVRLASGSLDETVISQEEAAALTGANGGDTTAVAPADGERLRLLVESARIRLAYTHDPHFAVSLSGIRTLPHSSAIAWPGLTETRGGRGAKAEASGSRKQSVALARTVFLRQGQAPERCAGTVARGRPDRVMNGCTRHNGCHRGAGLLTAGGRYV